MPTEPATADRAATIAAPPDQPAPAPPDDPVALLLRRPDDQRLREYKYRFSQAVVFGLPVIALQWKGPDLGGPEAQRWVGILQALLAGWVVYVGAAGMLFEGILMLRRQVTGDLAVAAASIAAYLFSLVSVLHILVDGRPWYGPLLFHASVLIVASWTGVQWFRGSRRLARGRSGGTLPA